MSEVIVSSGSQTFPDYGLEVINEQPVTLTNALFQAPFTETGKVSAIGSAARDVIRPISPTDPTIFTIRGGGGNDAITGAASNDLLFGDGGNDVVSGGDGDDQIQGNSGNDKLLGGGGDDNLAGHAGKDTIDGGAGDDIIQGGGGVDILTGGSGKDTFRFRKGSTGGPDKASADRITDFTPADDTIQFQGTLHNFGWDAGKLSKAEFKAVNEISDLDGDLGSAKIIYEEATGLVYGIKDNGDQVVLLQLGKNLPITAADFEIF